VIGAVHPEQLNQTAVFLAAQLAHGLEQRNPGRLSTVLSLCNNVLHLPEQMDEINCDQPKSQQRFRELLYSPANAVYKEDGTYLGQAIPFTLTPGMAKTGEPGFITRCAERLAEVDAVFSGDLANTTALPLKIAKRQTFYSETCADHIGDIGPIQEGTLRSSNNLLLDGAGAQFGQDFVWVRGQVNAVVDSSDPNFITRKQAGPTSTEDLGGRGLYGDYQVIVTPPALEHLVASPGGLRDIKVRFDFMSVEDLGTSPPPGTRQLSIEMRDGAGAVLTGADGNTVNTTCNNCTAGEVATISATPAAGWHFAGWTGACAGVVIPCTVVMIAAHKVWVIFIDDCIFVIKFFLFYNLFSFFSFII